MALLRCKAISNVYHPKKPALTKELLDRIEGKVTDRHRIESGPLVKSVFVPAQQLIEEERRQQELLESKN